MRLHGLVVRVFSSGLTKFSAIYECIYIHGLLLPWETAGESNEIWLRNTQIPAEEQTGKAAAATSY